MKSILKSIKENIINECSGAGVSLTSTKYPPSRFDKYEGENFLSYSSANYLQDLIIYIADNGKVSGRLRSDKSKQRQQALIDLCKDIKKAMKW